MKNRIKLSWIAVFLLFVFTGYAQEAEKEDTLTRVIDKLQSDITALTKLKISGYIQAQFQMADSAGAKGFSGGDFDNGIDNRFMIRRGRVKVAYTTAQSQFVVQLDANEKDGVSVKDAYLKFTEPLMNTVSFTGGIFNRPFGYEIEYSSSVRESPERSRIFQTLFSGERDLGACITFQAPKTSPLNILKIDAGLFNGINKKDFDNKKDFIGHITLNKQLLHENLKVGIGASYYNGRVIMSDTMRLLKMEGSSYIVDNARITPGTYSKREYKGLEAQFAYISSFGLSQLRGEYLWGESTGTKSSTKTIDKKLTEDIYLRSFSGWYILFSQNIAQLPLQVVAKYDVYDPNTKVKDKEIGAGGSLTDKGDIKYSTLGLGLIYRFDSNIKITAYYDIVKNETTSLSSNAKDLKDNVFTLRFQYKF